MNLEDRISVLSQLGDYIRLDGDLLNVIKEQAYQNNKWFTPDNINYALSSWGNDLLKSDVLESWVSKYPLQAISAKLVGMILAGNIPLVGFHDIVSTFISGHKALIKSSRNDSVLTTHLVEKMNAYIGNSKYLEITDSLKGMDAVIATGSNFSAGQFEKYFGKYPNIIRRNRNAVGIITGEESDEDILKLGKDIFTYFGLGCRNISKVYVPESYNFNHLMEVLHNEYKELINHSKYKNNYDYNYALYLLNQEEFLASGAIIIRKHEDITSRIACLHYEEYSDIKSLTNHLLEKANEFQCISSKVKFDGIDIIELGNCQQPKIDDYADGVDTMQFLSTLSS